MYTDIIPALRCPSCAAAPLTLLGALHDGDEITAGALRCTACGLQTPIIDGVWDAASDERLTRTPAQIVNYLPPAAANYERLWRWQALSLLSGRHFPLHEELTLLRQLMQPRAGKVYVDVACSDGLYARALAVPGAVLAGVDHSWPFVAHARQHALQAGLRVSYIRATAQHLPFGDTSADGAVMGGSLNEIGDQQAALAEIARILRPRARFFCMSLRRASTPWGRLLQQAIGSGGVVFPSQDTVNTWLRPTGLRPRARWRWGVVTITLLEYVPRTGDQMTG